MVADLTRELSIINESSQRLEEWVEERKADENRTIRLMADCEIRMAEMKLKFFRVKRQSQKREVAH